MVSESYAFVQLLHFVTMCRSFVMCPVVVILHLHMLDNSIMPKVPGCYKFLHVVGSSSCCVLTCWTMLHRNKFPLLHLVTIVSVSAYLHSPTEMIIIRTTES